MPDPLSINEVSEGTDRLVLALAGELDGEAAQTLGERVAGALSAGRKEIVVDLAGVGFVDSGGLGVIVAARAAMPADKQLRLVGARGNVARTFERAGLANMLERGPRGSARLG